MKDQAQAEASEGQSARGHPADVRLRGRHRPRAAPVHTRCDSLSLPLRLSLSTADDTTNTECGAETTPAANGARHRSWRDPSTTPRPAREASVRAAPARHGRARRPRRGRPGRRQGAAVLLRRLLLLLLLRGRRAVLRPRGAVGARRAVLLHHLHVPRNGDKRAVSRLGPLCTTVVVRPRRSQQGPGRPRTVSVWPMTSRPWSADMADRAAPVSITTSAMPLGLPVCLRACHQAPHRTPPPLPAHGPVAPLR